MRPRAWSALVLLGFGSGLPLILTDSTLKAWLKDAHIDLATIGFFALVQLPYNLKFLWAPLLDRFQLPFLGRRRGWLAATQILLAALLAVMAFGDPGGRLSLLAGLAVGIAFVSASQDTVTDAWRTEFLPPHQQAMGTAVHVTAYRIAILAAGAGALVVADRLGWRAAYGSMSALMLLGLLGTLLAEEPADLRAPRSLKEAVVEPFAAFLSRPGAWSALAFIILYKIGDQLASSLTVPYFMEVGFTKTSIGLMTKGVGMAALIAGGFISGWWMEKWTLKRGLLVCGLLQVASTLSLLLPAFFGARLPVLGAALALENLGYGMGVTVYMTLIMRLCDRRYTATQFSLLTSLAALSRTLLASPSGEIAKHTGWPVFFSICAVIAIPGLLMLARYDRWGAPEEAVS